MGSAVTPEPMRKVPELTPYFWITKVLTTAMGEATSDYLVKRLPPEVAVLFGGIALVLALIIQFAAPRYLAWIYWLAVAMVAVSGTMAADVLHVQFKIPYVVSSSFFAIVLVIVFVAWYSSERTLSIHSIDTRRREAFYWAAVMATFALGTAVGDLTATTLHLGYLLSGVIFAVIMMVPAFSYRFFHMNAIFAFWFAYVVTRPLGASFADWTGKSHRVGGLNFGDGRVALALTVVIVGFVGYLAVTRVDVADDRPAPSHPTP